MTLHYLSYKEIDRKKWDGCIATAENSLIYGYFFYLDALTKNWDAIIVNDYESVLPLPWKKKWGIKYYCNPPFTAQLGLFKKSASVITAEILTLMHQKVKYGDVFFNYKNTHAFSTLPQTNYVLNLRNGYECIFSNYKKGLKESLNKCHTKEFIYSSTENLDHAIELYKQYHLFKIPHLSTADCDRFLTLCQLLFDKKMGFTRSVLNNKNELLSIGIFLFDGKRIYNMINVTTAEGRLKESNAFLLDRVINEFSGKDIIFDFEGSDLEGVQFFYKKFNPVNEPYFLYHYNHLPGWIRRFKK